mmetsp:Transcript_86646/g.185653  ORF Transcript_86646/g.185653 Transcript_86646/m.185653 type:complete len:162 (-) Transcript_86646:28-513(-)
MTPLTPPAPAGVVGGKSASVQMGCGVSAVAAMIVNTHVRLESYWRCPHGGTALHLLQRLLNERSKGPWQPLVGHHFCHQIVPGQLAQALLLQAPAECHSSVGKGHAGKPHNESGRSQECGRSRKCSSLNHSAIRCRQQYPGGEAHFLEKRAHDPADTYPQV